MRLESLGVTIALAITFIIALWAVWKVRRDSRALAASTQGDVSYFTARGTLSPQRLFFSVFATTFSAFTVVGLPAMFYAQGIWTFVWMGVGIALTPVTLQLIGKRIVARADKSNAGSVLGLLLGDYNSRLLMVLVSFVTVIVLFPYLVLQIAGIGKFLLSVSDGMIGYTAGTVLLCVLVGFYVTTGGASADAETDFIQGWIMLIGVAVLGGTILIELVGTFGQNWERLEAAGLTSAPGPRGYFTPLNLISFGIIFTLISVSTPQVSQRLMGASAPEDLNPIIKIYAPVGLIVVALAGLMGLYAASNMKIATPDFVAGDVLRHLVTNAGSGYKILLFVVGTFFITAVISAALSTIDSVLLAIAGIASDNIEQSSPTQERRKLKPLSWAIILVGLLLASQPPTFITTLAAIQLSGLTSLLPCLLGPLFGYRSKISGWCAFVGGLAPILASRAAGVDFWGVDPGVIGLAVGLMGLQLGRLKRLDS
jgi:Na+/proline symporter